MRVHLVGGLGSIGSLVSCSMIQAGWSPICLVRPSQPPPYAKISLHFPTDTLHHCIPLQSLDHPDPISILVISTKSYSTLPILKQLQPRLSSSTWLVLIQNGVLDTADQVYHHFPLFHRIILGSTTLGAYRLPESTASHSHVCFNGTRGQTHIGLDPRYPPLDDTSTRILSKFKSLSLIRPLLYPPLSSSFLAHLLSKVAINACINTWTALLKCKNGALLHHDQAMQSIHQTCHEIHSIYSAVYPQEALLNERDVYDQVVQVIQLTANNYSSMYQDVHVYKHQTEMESILGYLIRLSNKTGVLCKEITTLYHKLHAIHSTRL